MSKFNIGDRVRIIKARVHGKERHIGDEFVISSEEMPISGEPAWSGDGDLGGYRWAESELELVPTGPVRTVTRKEIEPGHYGLIRINGACMSRKEVSWFVDGSWTTAKQIREAINTLGEIADALEDQK